jgi:hypothetical protein
MIGRATMLIALAALGVAWNAAAAQGTASRDSTGSHAVATRAELFIVQGVAGVAGGALGAVALGVAGYEVIGPHGGEDPGELGAMLGALTGLVVGIGGGVSSAAHLQGEPASFARASLGAFVGVLLIGALSRPLNLDAHRAPVWICLATIPPATAVLLNHSAGEATGPARHLAVHPLSGNRLGVGVSVGF